MKRWQLFVIFMVVQFTGIFLMAESMAQWHEIKSVGEIARIIACLACFSVSLTMDHKHKFLPLIKAN